jgi:hypothetical protein
MEGFITAPSGITPSMTNRHRAISSLRARADRLAVSRGAVRGGLFGQAGPAAAADTADGGAFDPEAHARPVRRGTVRALGREPVLSAVQRRGVLRPQVAVRQATCRAISMIGSRAITRKGRHQGRWCFGKTPIQTFLDATPLARSRAEGGSQARARAKRRGSRLQCQEPSRSGAPMGRASRDGLRPVRRWLESARSEAGTHGRRK